MTSIPFVDLGVIHRPLAEDFRAALDRALAGSSFVGGRAVEAFERDWAASVGARHCVGVSNGTDALILALWASGIGPGDEVITAPNTFVATVEAILVVGAQPVFVDVDPATGLLDLGRLRRRVGLRTRAVIPVHLWGAPVDVAALRAEVGPGLTVIEDAAQAHGARHADGSPVGSGRHSRAACWSFYPGKNLGALGDAGAVTTDDDALAARLRRLRDHGSARKYEHVEVGINARLDALQAAFLSAKLPRLEGWNESRRAAAAAYDRELRDVPGVGLFAVPPGAKSARHLYVIRIPGGRRDAVAAALAERGIGTGIHYPVPVHLQPGYAHLGFRPGQYPVAERLAGEILSLPMFAGITEDQVREVCAALRETLHP